MADTILLTGAAGFIGSNLAERLLTEGATVVGVDNFDPFYDPAEKRGNLARAMRNDRFRLVTADCADLPRLRDQLGDLVPDAIVHLAAKAGVRPSIADPVAYARSNLLATQAVLELAREREVQRIVFGSSSSVYGNNEKVPFSEDDPVDRPISPYAATKRAGELLCHAHHHLHDASILALRFFTVYGPRQRPDLAIRKFTRLLSRGEPVPMFGDGSTERDYTWIDDIVDGVVAAVDRTRDAPREFEIVNLGGSRTTRLDRLIELIAQALDIEPEIRRLPMQPGDVRRTYADVEKAHRLLGYSPATPIEEGIPRFVRWFTRSETAGTPDADTPPTP